MWPGAGLRRLEQKRPLREQPWDLRIQPLSVRLTGEDVSALGHVRVLGSHGFKRLNVEVVNPVLSHCRIQLGIASIPEGTRAVPIEALSDRGCRDPDVLEAGRWALDQIDTSLARRGVHYYHARLNKNEEGQRYIGLSIIYVFEHG